MVLRRLLGKKKDDEEDKDDSTEVAKETEVVSEAEETEDIAEVETEIAGEPAEVIEEPVEVIEEPDTIVSGTIPYHDTLQDRLMYLLKETAISSTIEGPDSFCLEFMAMGERFVIEKPSMGNIEMKSGSAKGNDAHIRISNDTVSDLLSASTYNEFKSIFMNFYKNPEAGKFVKIEMYEDVSNLNRRGYARVPLLKLLIGAAR